MVLEINFGGFLRKLFGPFQADIWQEFSEDMGYECSKGSWLEKDQVTAKILGHTVTMDVVQRSRYSTNTRLQAVVANPHQLGMKIYRHTGFAGIGKLLGMQDVEVGYPQRDQDFIIKGNGQGLLRQICSNYLIRSLLLQEWTPTKGTGLLISLKGKLFCSWRFPGWSRSSPAWPSSLP
jgi:hypothetical protein